MGPARAVNILSRWTQKRASRRARLLLIAALVLPIITPAVLYARAGGGEGYHNGGGEGGGGGGGHGGGGASFYLFYLLIRLCIEHPLIGIPVLIIVVLFVVKSGQQGTNTYQSNIIRRGGDAIDTAQKSAAIATIKQHDSRFDETAFSQRVANAFNKIQAAWTAQDLKSVRAFISDGVFERFSLQFADQRDRGFRNMLQNLSIEDIRIVDLNSSGVFDEISVRIAARCADFRASLANGRIVDGSTDVMPFVEFWSFLRKRGAISQMTRAGLMEGNCPNCGAPIELNESANCTHCKALLRSGEYDWVLTEITQESEWQGARPPAAPGVAELRESDAGFDPLALEDRASVAFWRRAAADRLGKIDPVRKIASDDFCQRYAPTLKPVNGAPRSFAGECAVGSVNMLGYLPSPDTEQFEQALVEIRWSGTNIQLDPNGRWQPTGDLIARTLFIFGRKPGSVTDAGKSISSAHCPNCGAPEAGGVSNACQYCNTVLNDGAHGWVLLDTMPMASRPATQLLLQLRQMPVGALSVDRPVPAIKTQPRPSDAGLMAWAVRVAAADGNVNPDERRMLQSFAAGRNIPDDQLAKLIKAALARRLDVPAPADRNEAEEWLSAMAETALVDGDLGKDEYPLLVALGGKVGLAEYDVKQILKQARTRQYAAASDALRAQRRSQSDNPN